MIVKRTLVAGVTIVACGLPFRCSDCVSAILRPFPRNASIRGEIVEAAGAAAGGWRRPPDYSSSSSA